MKNCCDIENETEFECREKKKQIRLCIAKVMSLYLHIYTHLDVSPVRCILSSAEEKRWRGTENYFH